MENYNIYDEIGRGTHSFVYKARRKRSIEYVAVKSTAKCRMDKVRLLSGTLSKYGAKHVTLVGWTDPQRSAVPTQAG